MRSFINTTTATLCVSLFAAMPASADPFLDEVVDFQSTIFYFEAGVPGVVVAAVKGDDAFVTGMGETRKGNGVTPTGDSTLRIGSITKAFTGQVLAQLVADGLVSFTTPAAELVDGELGKALADWPSVSLVQLATHSGGLPREVPRAKAEDPADPYATLTTEAFTSWFNDHQPLYTPGRNMLYSNFGFDILSAALSGAIGSPYAEYLDETILSPLNMNDTGFERSTTNAELAMYGHGFDGEPLPHIISGKMNTGSGGLTSTANDMVKWIKWHLNEKADEPETRLLDHAVYFQRDHFDQVQSMDESGRLDGAGLGWVAMYETDDHPFILQKAGGMQGELSYVALAPAHDVGVFISINEYNFSAALGMASFANDLVATLSGY
ncbi:D-alanyl-D-alanine-carboxypeptidase/endopeptidase AmpH [Martelella mediterranea]|uniref:D-alanyl-D-alanine-carboxypeptidase/D-alanyl-D-alanine-endopeptidase n=1 Tax=Martelella mediterranea TaxID=293089 RepID=A0A4R3NQV2_9HYPH|nr:D-alanyl-D-alanine-carboxypeptidase/endopeptidase AmpH [Martelella mediterranea]TCT37166.1 D-alanyl-D-alanine-carboxypeptidase/D-alanyl-D-alanine-endopeptidase [Martelella mediterranea]